MSAWYDAAIEIEFGHSKADEGVASLKAVAAKMETVGAPKPTFLATIEGFGGYAYQREDGVLVVPIAALAP